MRMSCFANKIHKFILLEKTILGDDTTLDGFSKLDNHILIYRVLINSFVRSEFPQKTNKRDHNSLGSISLIHQEKPYFIAAV